jgi:transcriptional regulator with XRE-family HTH domain
MLKGRTNLFPEYSGSFGPVVRKHRLAQNMTSGQLAASIGYTARSEGTESTAVLAWEKGANEMSLPTLCKVAEVLGVDFVDDVADVLFECAKRGLANKRDKHLREAGDAAHQLKTVQRKPRSESA